MDSTEGKRVGIWIRVSTEDQARGESPEHHERRARFYAESKGWVVREVYHLEAVSGKAVMQHPEAERMLADIGNGHITGLIFSKLARLARNTKELLEFADIFREHDADLISLQESIDTSTPAGRLLYTMIAALAAWEREEIGSRVAASVQIRARLGRPTGGKPPFGYHWVDKRLVPHPVEAPVRRLTYELFLKHRRVKTVADELNRMGHRARRGKFTDTTVRRLLMDRTARGEHVVNSTKSLGDRKHWKRKPKEEWIVNPVEPIVSAETWDATNAILEERTRSRKPKGRRAVHLFTGLVHCGACDAGAKMYVPSNSPKYTCYQCRNKIPIEDLEAVFDEQLRGYHVSSKEVTASLEQADHVIAEKTQLLQSLESEAAKTRSAMDKIYRAYIDDQLSAKGFGRQYRPLEERLSQLEDQIPDLQGEVDFLKIQHLSKDQILAETQDLYSRLPGLAFEEKRRIVETVTEKVVVGHDEVQISLCYLPAMSKDVADSQRSGTGSSKRRG
ncbi:MAG: recombinase family protein [bacterium]|nr:recombinase family protein [bacterium]